MKVRKDWFLHQGANILNEAIMYLGLHPALSRTEVVRATVGCHHRVYIMNFPGLFKCSGKSNTSKEVLGCSAGDDHSVAIKTFVDWYPYPRRLKRDLDHALAGKVKCNRAMAEKFYVLRQGKYKQQQQQVAISRLNGPQCKGSN